MRPKSNTTKTWESLSVGDRLTLGRYNQFVFKVVEIDGFNVKISRINKNANSESRTTNIDELKSQGFKKLIE